MSTITKIQWTDHTFNPWIGCTKVSDGCKFCYAENLMDKRWGKVEWGPNGTRVRTSSSNWNEPRKWNKAARIEGREHLVFCASLADVGEDRPELVPWREALEGLIVECDWLRFQLLTKRPENMPKLFHEHVLRRCWIGTSVEDQRSASERIPHLLRCPAMLRFLSCEPLLAPVDLRTGIYEGPPGAHLGTSLQGIDWVIVGGESGREARACNVAWIKAIVEQCQQENVPVFVKQFGSHVIESADPGDDTPFDPDATVRIRLKDNKGGNPEEWPEHLRVRQFPGDIEKFRGLKEGVE